MVVVTRSHSNTWRHMCCGTHKHMLCDMDPTAQCTTISGEAACYEDQLSQLTSA